MKTDPRRGGHERFRVSKKNFENKSLNFSKLSELEHVDTTSAEYFRDDDWYPDTTL